MPASDALTAALLALRRGPLRPVHGTWWAGGPGGEQEIPAAVVARLRAERWVEPHPITASMLHLTARGAREAEALAARAAQEERRARRTAPLRAGPVVTLRPADHSEDPDHLLALSAPPGTHDLHRARIGAATRLADDDAFDFVQYRMDVWTIPIHDAAVRAGLLPGDDPPIVRHEGGIPDADAWGARWCPDRGINYGSGTVQTFGGPGEAGPLVVSPAVPADVFLAAFARTDAAPPSEAQGAPLRAITGFHRDEEGHWVAELACGHGQHVRDDPPWVERPWTRSAGGRASMLGVCLPCLKCLGDEGRGGD